jgi:hypothetical protein
LADVEDIITFLKENNVIRGDSVSYDGIIHYSEQISIALNLPPEKAIARVLQYLHDNGYILV